MSQSHVPIFAHGEVKRVLIIGGGDCANYFRQCQTAFDLIISDCTDPVGPGDVLFTSGFYADCKKCLTNNGVFVAQNGVAYMQLDEVITTAKRLSPYFAEQTFLHRWRDDICSGN